MNTTHNYSHFYVLLKDMPFSGDRDDLKEILVYRYTGGRTTSLKEMHYSEYRQMCADMKSAIAGDPHRPSGAPNANTWRKRVIAVIGQYLRNTYRKENIQTIKSIACRAARYDDFNLIPVSRLQNIYYAFKNKNKDFARVGEVVYEDIELMTFLN